MFFVSVAKKEFSFILIFKNFEKSQKIAKNRRLFVHASNFSEMTLKKFNKFKKKVLKFKLQRNQFFRRNSKNVFMKQIIDDFDK